MNKESQKRPWFQIHLSTAVVLMFVAGGLIWANITPQHGCLELLYGDVENVVIHRWHTDYQATWYGFPFFVYKPRGDFRCYDGYQRIITNTLMNLTILFGVGCFLERRLYKNKNSLLLVYLIALCLLSWLTLQISLD